jgi:hypothetical protein
MTNMIRKVSLAVKGGPGGAGIWAFRKGSHVDNGRIFIDRAGSGEASKEVIRTEKIINTGAANLTLTAADDGATVVFNDATSRTVTLPATAKNLRFTFIIKAPTAGAGHLVTPIAADKVMGNGFTSADDKGAICTGASDREGDAIVLVGDGLDGYFIESVTGTWAREA